MPAVVPTQDAQVVAPRRAAARRARPRSRPPPSFLGAQFDAGLAWVHFPEGHGGLGLSPELQKSVDERLAEAGAPNAYCRNPIGYGMGAPTVARPRQRGAEAAATCGRCSPARRSGASSSASPAPGSDVAGLADAGPCATATSGSSTARRCGPRWPTWPGGGCSSPAPTPTQPKHKGMTYFVRRHAGARRRGPAAAPDHRRGRVQRGVLHRRPHPRRRAPRRRGRGLAGVARPRS